jgi:glycosidase
MLMILRPLAAALLALAAPIAADAQGFRERLPEDEVIYFVLPDRFENGDPSNDRGGLTGDRLATGYDPTSRGFFHGGDLAGLTARLDYLQGMGITAIWVGPIFKNKPVQGRPGQESAGYHGYWITDFTQPDPHFGTADEFKAFVDAAHARGMKVYMDIVANHTADVIQYRECATGPCPYRNLADYPYRTRGGIDGAAINDGFQGHDVRTAENFARLTDPTFAYTPVVPAAERNTKVPAWLNDPIFYHNRGNTTFLNESATLGDFAGLDDLMTEHPRVVDGMIEIFGGWIDRFGIDGFRIDTARHVDPAFWAAFVPAMLERATARGIPNFHIFGEVALLSTDVGQLAKHTRVDKFPAVLDFAFRQALVETVAGRSGTVVWEGIFAGDSLYENGYATALRLPTFSGNHDNGRFAHAIRDSLPDASEEEVAARVKLAHAMLLTLRGVPTIYSGDEQGFVGDGGDQDSREDMFPSRVDSYNDNRLLATTATTAASNFDTAHPFYRQIGELARVRTATPALTRGEQRLRVRGDEPGMLAISRFDPDTGQEVLLAFNTSTAPVEQQVQVEVGSDGWRSLGGPCAARSSAPGSVRVALPPLGYAICAAAPATR